MYEEHLHTLHSDAPNVNILLLNIQCIFSKNAETLLYNYSKFTFGKNTFMESLAYIPVSDINSLVDSLIASITQMLTHLCL